MGTDDQPEENVRQTGFSGKILGKDKSRPHILFILADQLRADCLGCAGHYLLKTPHIDRLASKNDVSTKKRHCRTGRRNAGV